jgi:hypothetical protein
LLEYLAAYKSVKAFCERDVDHCAEWMSKNVFPAERLRNLLHSTTSSHEVADLKRETEAFKNKLLTRISDDLHNGEQAFKLMLSNDYAFVGKLRASELGERYETLALDHDAIRNEFVSFFDEALARISDFHTDLRDHEDAERQRLANNLVIKELEVENLRGERAQKALEAQQHEREANAVRTRAEQAEKNALEIKKRAEKILKLEVEKQRTEAETITAKRLADEKEIEKAQKKLEAQRAEAARNEQDRLRDLEARERPQREEAERLKAEQEREDAVRAAQERHEVELAKVELLKIKEQRVAAEAARDAAALAKAQESDQFASILKSLRVDNDG